MVVRLVLSASVRDAIVRHALEEYPTECCGVIFQDGDGFTVRRCRNVQDELHRRDPVTHPRTARHAYSIGLDDYREIERLTGAGHRLVSLYHSHPDLGAYFSETDRKVATVPGDPPMPVWPDTVYIVMGVGSDKVREVKAFEWDEERKEFKEIELCFA